MAIDPLSEEVVSLTEATKLLPHRRRGKRPHVSCIYRWTTSGCRGVILESIQVGGTRCTSKQALARFFERLTNANSGETHQSPPRQRGAAEDADRKLREQGF